MACLDVMDGRIFSETMVKKTTDLDDIMEVYRMDRKYIKAELVKEPKETIAKDLMRLDILDSPIKAFVDIGYTNLNDVMSWWEDEKELYEEDSEEDIMMSYFNEKFGETSDFMDIVNNNHFSQQMRSALFDVYTDFQPIFGDYTPWEWFSWYIHVYMFARTPASCPFHSGKIVLPERIRHFHYQGAISTKIKKTEVENLKKSINTLVAENNHQSDSKVWYHGTHSVHAASIARGIDLTEIDHFGHAFGFRRSFYIGENLQYCLTRALRTAKKSNVNCALVVFCIDEKELHEYNPYLKLISREDLQDYVDTDNVWEDIVQISKNSNRDCSSLDDDPIKPGVQWVEGANLGKSEDNDDLYVHVDVANPRSSIWAPKKDDIIRSFRTDASTQFLHSQLAYIITFKNPRVKSEA